jgi:hypothetical protein
VEHLGGAVKDDAGTGGDKKCSGQGHQARQGPARRDLARTAINVEISTIVLVIPCGIRDTSKQNG